MTLDKGRHRRNKEPGIIWHPKLTRKSGDWWRRQRVRVVVGARAATETATRTGRRVGPVVRGGRCFALGGGAAATDGARTALRRRV